MTYLADRMPPEPALLDNVTQRAERRAVRRQNMYFTVAISIGLTAWFLVGAAIVDMAFAS